MQGEKDKKPIIKLFVEMNEGITYNQDIEKKIKDEINLRLLKYSMPSEIIPIEKMPLTDIGKVDYKKL